MAVDLIVLLFDLYTRYPIVARALGLPAVQPLGRVRARAKESCIQLFDISGQDAQGRHLLV